MTTEIKKEDWNICKICNESLSSMVEEYGGSGVYRTQCFKKHIEEKHQIKMDDYFNNGPDCPCGICGNKRKVMIKGALLKWKEYGCGRNPGVLSWSEKAKISRRGENNPMYGKVPWNSGLSKENNESLRAVSIKRTGTKASESTRKKQSESAKLRDFHGHTGCKHTEENKEKSRLRTLQMIKDGVFNQTDTKPSRIIRSILDEYNFLYEKEYVVGKFSFDYFLINENTLLEVDGDYFHSNPLIYPNGPETKTQKINSYRDKVKNEFCEKSGLKLIRFWEHDILRKKEWVVQKLLELKK
jgi:very-short-patch-repair endonuclease